MPRRVKPTRKSLNPEAELRGTSRDTAVRKLARERPDLYSMVVARKLSAHAAMIEAGFRTPAFTVRDSPMSIALTLRRRWSPERVAELVELLTRDHLDEGQAA